MRVSGNWALIATLLLLCMAAIFALGFFFTAIAPTERICQLLCYIAYFLMLFLSGASFPQEMLPEAVRKISALCAMNKQALYRRSTPPAILFQVNRSGGYRELLQFLDQIRHCISAVNTV